MFIKSNKPKCLNMEDRTNTRGHNLYRIRTSKKLTDSDPHIKGAILFNKLPRYIKELDGKHFGNELKL